MKRFGDEMLVDFTIYDSKAFAFPWHEVAIFKNAPKNWLEAPSNYVSCEWTNHVFLANGQLEEHAPGDPGFQDPTDLRPWATAYADWAKANPKLAADWNASFKKDEEAAARR